MDRLAIHPARSLADACRTHRTHEVIKVCCSKLLSFGVICYSAIDNEHRATVKFLLCDFQRTHIYVSVKYRPRSAIPELKDMSSFAARQFSKMVKWVYFPPGTTGKSWMHYIFVNFLLSLFFTVAILLSVTLAFKVCIRGCGTRTWAEKGQRDWRRNYSGKIRFIFGL